MSTGHENTHAYICEVLRGVHGHCVRSGGVVRKSGDSPKAEAPHALAHGQQVALDATTTSISGMFNVVLTTHAGHPTAVFDGGLQIQNSCLCFCDPG